MRRSVLILLALGFLTVVVTRAFAFNAAPEDAAVDMVADKITDPVDLETGLSVPLPQDPQMCLTGTVLEALKVEREQLETRLESVTQREAIAKALEVDLEQTLANVEKANEQLASDLAALRQAASDDISHLVDMYRTMKPKQAAEILDAMDPAFAAGFLREMNGAEAGLIMANMSPRKSYAISVIIAGKRQEYRD